MAKKKRKPESQKPVSGNLSVHEAEQALLNYLTKMPDVDEVLRKAGITRHRLKVMMYDDEVYQAIEKRQDRLEGAPWRLEPAEGIETEILYAHLREWWSEIILGAQNARWYGYSVLEGIYSRPENPKLHIQGDTVTPFIGFEWIGEKPLQWYEPKNNGSLLLLKNYNHTHQDQEVDQRFKHFLTRCKSTFENPYGEALLSRLYWVWFFKTNGFKFWSKFVEKYGMPLLVGKSSTGHNQDMRDALLKAHATSVLAISSMDSVELHSASAVGNGSQAYETFDKNLERRIQKVVLGQTLTSGTDGSGSRALGDVHLEVQNAKYRADIRMITPTVQAIINALCDLNGWKRRQIILGEEKSLEPEKAERDVKLKGAGANFSNAYFIREYGLQDGDLIEASQLPSNKFTYTPKQAFSFKASANKLSGAQQEVEELADGQDELTLLNDTEIKQLIGASDGPETLAFNLMQLIPKATKTEFTAKLDQALYAADILGYMAAGKGE